VSGRSVLLVGIDVGTTVTKAGLVDDRGRELARTAVPTSWEAVPTGGNAHPEVLFSSVRAALAELLEAAPAGDIVGCGITSMAETVVLLDASGVPIEPAVAWYDTRAAAEHDELLAEFGSAFGRTTGLGTSQIPTIATLRWLVRNVPGTRAAARALGVAEWIAHRLGGEDAAEASIASRTGGFSVVRRTWWSDAIRWTGARDSLFPPVRQAGTSFGRVSGGAVTDGLERLRGAVLTVGGHDHLCASVGNGVTRPSQVMDSCGTAEALIRSVAVDDAPDPSAGLALGIETGCHVLPDSYALVGGLALGLVLIPLLAKLGARTEHGCTSLDAEALLVDLDGIAELSDADGPVPPVGALRVTDGSAGWPVPRPGEPPALTWRRALGRAVAGSRELLDGLEQLGGPVTEVRLSGGWSTNPLLRELKSAAFVNPVYPRVAEAGIRGAALLAGLAAERFTSVDELPEPAVADELVTP